MSYEGYYQVICKNGHFYEVPEHYGTNDSNYFNCEECLAGPAWINKVDDTNCDAIGHVKVSVDFQTYNVLQLPSPQVGRWLINREVFQAMCPSGHYYETKMIWSEESSQFEFPKCPHCKKEPIWTNEFDSGKLIRIALKVGFDKKVKFKDWPNLDQGVWTMLEGGEHIKVTDFEKVTGSVSLMEYCRYHSQSGATFVLDNGYPHDWIVPKATAVMILNYMKQRAIYGELPGDPLQ